VHSIFPSGFIQRFLSTPERSGETTSGADQQEQATTPHASFGPSNPALLLAEWARIKLTSYSWKDVLVAAVGVSIFALRCAIDLTLGLKFTVPRIMIYRAICECLEMADRLTDATDCFYQMVNELAITQDEEAKWVLGE
jgi:hypothetical protein